MPETLRFAGSAILLLGFVLSAQDTPAGWKAITDKQGACKISVPGDWTPDKLVPSFLNSPDGKATAVAHGLRAGQSFAGATAMAKQVTPPSRMIEDSARRVWYAYQNPGPPKGTNWYVAVAGSPVCTATVTFQDPATEETAKKIALSLTQAK